MRLLPLLALMALTSRSAAQDDLVVLKADKEGVPPRKLLYSYLQAEAQKHFDARRKAVAELKTPHDVQRRQRELRAAFLAALGGFPEKTPLNSRVVGKEARDGYRIERIIYESRPQHHVTAVLYLPEGKPPFPGVLMPCGHSANGKAAEPYQRACILMAKNGLAVLCYDPIGQGERIQLLNAQGKPAIAGSTSEHDMIGVGALLVGQSTATYRIWDGIRSIDYLAGRSDIDSKRLGCTGNSGGGTLTAYLMALDDRIAAAAPSCYLTTLERLFATIGPQDAEQNITGQVAFGMDHADYLTLRAPKPTLMCVATRDYFDIDGAWTTFREAKRVYGILGHGERVDLFEYGDTHGFSKPRREAAMRWLRRWLLKMDDAPVEGDFPIFKDEELQCTRTGQVLEEFKGKSAFDLTAEQARQLAKARTVQTGKELVEQVQRLTHSYNKPRWWSSTIAEAGKIARDGYEITKLSFQPPSDVPLPMLLFSPKEPGRRPLVLYLNGDGKAADAAPGGPIEKLVKAGRRVLAVDLRGMGETGPGTAPANRPNFFGTDTKEAFLALHLDRPLLGQRVEDMRAIIAWLGVRAINSNLKFFDKPEFDIIGVGGCGPIALHAAVLEPWIREVTIERSVLSWSAVAETPISHNQLTNVVPGSLKVYDLPDLAAALVPRTLTIRSPVDPVGKSVSQAALDEAYTASKAAYKKAAAKLTLQAEH